MLVLMLEWMVSLHKIEDRKREKNLWTELSNAYISATRHLGPSRRGDRKELVRDWKRKWEIMGTIRGDSFIKEELAKSFKFCGCLKLRKGRLWKDFKIF